MHHQVAGQTDCPVSAIGTWRTLKPGNEVGPIRVHDRARVPEFTRDNVEHEGHVPRVCLALMETEAVVGQDVEAKLWRLRSGASPTKT